MLSDRVTSFTLVWIKMSAHKIENAPPPVTSFTLVWIKILSPARLSPPR